MYKIPFFKECGNIASKKFSEYSVWHCSISSWVSRSCLFYFNLYLIPHTQKDYVILPSQPLTPLPMFSMQTSAQERKSRTAKKKEQKEEGKHHSIFWEVKNPESTALQFKLQLLVFSISPMYRDGKSCSSCPIKFVSVDCYHQPSVLQIMNSKSLLHYIPHLRLILQT